MARNIPASEDLKFDKRQNFVHKAIYSMGCCNSSAKTCGVSYLYYTIYTECDKSDTGARNVIGSLSLI